MDPSNAISLAKDVFNIITFIIRVARQDTLEMREWVEAIAALQFQLVRAEDSLTVVQDWELFMNIDSAAGRAVAQRANKVRLHERVNELHNELESLQKLFKQSQLDLDNTTRWDLIIIRINVFAKERKVMPLQERRTGLRRLVKHLDRAMVSVRDSYIQLRDSSNHIPIATTECVAAHLKQAFKDSPFCLQFHPTGHFGDDLLEFMSSRSALPELKEILAKCGQDWVELQLRADDNADIDGLHRVEKLHQSLVSRLYQVLEEWQTSFPDLTKEVAKDALAAKRELMEWFVTSCRRYLALTVAIGGRVSEGKSSLLNAILGRTILPTDRVVETAVPCCIRHVPNQITPALRLPYVVPYNRALEQYRGRQPESHYSEEQQKQLNELTTEKLTTKKYEAICRKLSDSSYTIPSEVQGEESIRELLGLLNVLTRFSLITANGIDLGIPDQWPLLTVEFRGLTAFRNPATRLRKISGSGYFQFLDCPGFNEEGLPSKESDHFKQLMRRAACSSDAVVPVVSLPSLQSNLHQTEVFIRGEWKGRMTAIVITKIQQEVVRNDRKELMAVAAWDESAQSNKVFCCDSLLGLGGLRLRDYLSESERISQEVQDEGGPVNKGILQKFQENDLTSKLSLYGLDTSPGLESISKAQWETTVQRNLDQSRIESIFDVLTSHSITEAQKTRLKHFDKLVPSRMYTLLKTLDSQMTGHAAKEGLKRSKTLAAEARKAMQVAFLTWVQDGEKKKSYADYQARVEQRLETIEKDLESSVAVRIEKEMTAHTKWDNQEDAKMFLQNIVVAARQCTQQSDAAINETKKGLRVFYHAELLDLLRKTAERKFKNNQTLQAIITDKITSLQDTTSPLHAEIRMQTEEPRSTKGWGFRQYLDDLTPKKMVRKVTRAYHSRSSSFKESGTPTSSSASSSQVMLFGGPSRSRTPTPSLHSLGYPTAEASSSQQTFLPVPGREQATTINGMAANPVEGALVGGNVTLGALTEEDERNLQDICASSENLSSYIAKTVVNPFLQSIRADLTRLSDLHYIKTVYDSTIVGISRDYEKAVQKEDDQRERTPEDQRARSALAHLQLWANITAAVSAIEALSKARKEAEWQLTDIRSSVSRLSYQ